MSILGNSSIPQPANMFTLNEYRAFIEQYRHIWKASYGASDELSAMRVTYRARLPVYLLARCPICDGRVWEPIDTYSLNGPGWQYPWAGTGWMGSVALPLEQQKLWTKTKPISYETDCPHVEIVSWCVNLNGLTPDDVFTSMDIISEVPFVMRIPMAAEGVLAVLHTLPIGRYDDPEPRPRYTAYFMTYFATDKPAFMRATAAWRSADEPPGRVGQPFDYDLVTWVTAKRLFWLDPTDPALPLRSQPLRTFPYAHVQGRQYPANIVDGHLEGMTYSGPLGWLWKFIQRG